MRMWPTVKNTWQFIVFWRYLLLACLVLVCTGGYLCVPLWKSTVRAGGRHTSKEDSTETRMKPGSGDLMGLEARISGLRWDESQLRHTFALTFHDRSQWALNSIESAQYIFWDGNSHRLD